MEKIIAYLDTCIVSGLAKEDLARSDIEALVKVLQKHKEETISLVTSGITKEEIDRVPKEFRLHHEVIYNLLSDIPVARAFQRDTGLSLLGVGGGMRLHPLLAQLNTLLTDEADARHLYQAARNGIQYFITTDVRTILRYKEKIEVISQVKVVSPIEFLDALNNIGI